MLCIAIILLLTNQRRNVKMNILFNFLNQQMKETEESLDKILAIKNHLDEEVDEDETKISKT
jgi:hypothetical protein